MSNDSLDNPMQHDASSRLGFPGSGRVWAIVIVPALLSGLFAIGPTIYQELTKPLATLSFSRISGPTIGSPEGFRQISLLRVENAGRTTLTNVSIEGEIANGQVDAIKPAGGLKTTIQRNDKRVEIVVERMLPTETLSVSVMTVSQSPQEALKFAVRSNEVLGSEIAADPKSRTVKPEVVSAILAFAGATLGALTLFLFRRRLTLGLLTGVDRSDVVTYILSLSGAATSLSLLPHENRLTYRRASDLLFFAAQSGNAERRAKCIIGLKALVAAAPLLHVQSAALIRSNLDALGVKLSDEEFNLLRAKSGKTLEVTEAREIAWQMFRAEEQLPPGRGQ